MTKSPHMEFNTVSAALSSPSLEQIHPGLLDRVNHSPAALAKLITEPMEAIAFFRILLDHHSDTSPTADQLNHLVDCVLAVHNPFCMNELVAWVRGKQRMSTLIAVVNYRLCGRKSAGLRNLLMDSACAEAAAVLSGRTN